MEIASPVPAHRLDTTPAKWYGHDKLFKSQQTPIHDGTDMFLDTREGSVLRRGSFVIVARLDSRNEEIDEHVVSAVTGQYACERARVTVFNRFLTGFLKPLPTSSRKG